MKVAWRSPTKAPLSLNLATGFRMARLYLQAPEVASDHFLKLNKEGYRNFILLQHTWASLSRGSTVFCLGALLGICHGAYELGLWPV